MIKVGRTDEGRSMAKAHTGHLTGSDAVTSAVFRQFGITRVDGLDELLDVSMALARTRPEGLPEWARAPREPGVAVYAISGGTGAHMADVLADAGSAIPDLSPGTQRTLHDGLIPSYLRVSNPIDCGGPPVADARGRKIAFVMVVGFRQRIDLRTLKRIGERCATAAHALSRRMGAKSDGAHT